MRSYVLLSAALMLWPLSAAAGEAPNAPAGLEKRAEAIEKAGSNVPFKFGIVSEGEVLDNLEEKKNIEADMDLLENKAREILYGMQKDYTDLETEVNLHAEGSAERKAKEKELEEKKREMTLKYRSLNSDIQQEAKKRLDQIRIKIRQHIARYARKHGYALVIEKTALLFCAERKSLTTQIIDQMNAEYFEEE